MLRIELMELIDYNSPPAPAIIGSLSIWFTTSFMLFMCQLGRVSGPTPQRGIYSRSHIEKNSFSVIRFFSRR